MVTGFYNNIKFEFSDVTIKTLALDLNNWVKTSPEVQKTELTRVQLIMNIPADCVQNVSPNVLKNFVQTFPQNYFKLALEEPKSKQLLDKKVEEEKGEIGSKSSKLSIPD